MDRPLRSDEMLVVAAQSGDIQAFECLYRLHSSKVMGLCLRMTRRRDVAQDCTQQTFIKAWRNLQAFERRSAFSTWLHQIAVNEVLRHAHNRGTRFESDDKAVEENAESVPHYSSRACDTAEVMDVERCLATLPAGSRHVIVLQAVYGYSHEEVADMLGIAVDG